MFPGFNNSKKRGTISRGDFDRDGKSNRRDCEPLNHKMQDDGETGFDKWIREEEASYNKLTPKQKALANEGLLDF